jgi:hypothetical protein
MSSLKYSSPMIRITQRIILALLYDLPFGAVVSFGMQRTFSAIETGSNCEYMMKSRSTLTRFAGPDPTGADPVPDPAPKTSSEKSTDPDPDLKDTFLARALAHAHA